MSVQILVIFFFIRLMSFQISDVFVKVLILDIDLFLHICFANIFFFSVIQSCPTVFGPWTVAPRQAPLSMKFSRQVCCSGLPFPTPEDHPDPGLDPMSLAPSALAGGFFTTSATWEAHFLLVCVFSFSQQCILETEALKFNEV